MSFSPLTYKYSLNRKNNKIDVPTSPCHCNCCTCHCSCCCCHCKCLCHLISTKSTENNILISDDNERSIFEKKQNLNINKKIRGHYRENSSGNMSYNNVFSTDLNKIKKNMIPCYSTVNIPIKDSSKTITNNLNSFNNELMGLKMRLMDEKKNIKPFRSSLNFSNNQNTAFKKNNLFIPKNYFKVDNMNLNNNKKREILNRSKNEFYNSFNSNNNDNNNINLYNSRNNSLNQRQNCNDCGNEDLNNNIIITQYETPNNLTYSYERNNQNNINNKYINQENGNSPCSNLYSNPCSNNIYYSPTKSFSNITQSESFNRTRSPCNPTNNFQKILYDQPLSTNNRNFINQKKYDCNKFNNRNLPSSVPKRKNRLKELENLQNNYIINKTNNQNLISPNKNEILFNNDNQNIYKSLPKNPRNSKSNNYLIQKIRYEIIGDNTKDLIINELNKKIEDLIEEFKNSSNNNIHNGYNYESIIQNQSDEINNLKSQFLKLNSDNNILNNKLTNLQNENDELKEQINLYKLELNQLKINKPKKKYLEEEIPNNENEILKNELDNLKKNFNKLDIENKKLNQEILSFKNNNFPSDNKNLNSNFLKYKNNLPELEEENQKLIQQILEYKKNISTLIDDNKKLTNQRIDDQKDISDLIEKNKIFNKQVMEHQNNMLTLQEENKNLLNKINDYNLTKVNNKLKSIKSRNDFDNLEIKNGGKVFFKGIPYTEEEIIKKINKRSKSTQKFVTNTLSSKLISKFKIETNLNVVPLQKMKVVGNINELGGSDSLIFRIYDGKNIMCYDMKSKGFYFFDFADYNNFSNNYINDDDNGNIILSYNSLLYIITGKNYDMFYCFNAEKKGMEKLCNLKNNHSKGNLISYHNSIICLSGQYNKKCEIYSILKNEWNEMKEMNIERSEFGSCIINDKYLFSIFGFNCPKNEYLNTIEYLDLLTEDSNWEYLNYKNEYLLSMYIKGLLTINYNDEKIILIGGYNGELNKPIEEFSQIILGNNFKEESYIDKVNRKLKDINKNKLYIFNSGITEIIDEKNRLYNIAYDNEDRIHIFEIRTMTHDVFNFE